MRDWLQQACDVGTGACAALKLKPHLAKEQLGQHAADGALPACPGHEWAVRLARPVAAQSGRAGCGAPPRAATATPISPTSSQEGKRLQPHKDVERQLVEVAVRFSDPDGLQHHSAFSGCRAAWLSLSAARTNEYFQSYAMYRGSASPSSGDSASGTQGTCSAGSCAGSCAGPCAVSSVEGFETCSGSCAGPCAVSFVGLAGSPHGQ